MNKTYRHIIVLAQLHVLGHELGDPIAVGVRHGPILPPLTVAENKCPPCPGKKRRAMSSVWELIYYGFCKLLLAQHAPGVQ